MRQPADGGVSWKTFTWAIGVLSTIAILALTIALAAAKDNAALEIKLNNKDNEVLIQVTSIKADLQWIRNKLNEHDVNTQRALTGRQPGVGQDLEKAPQPELQSPKPGPQPDSRGGGGRGGTTDSFRGGEAHGRGDHSPR